jgi:hypothetical protein
MRRIGGKQVLFLGADPHFLLNFSSTRAEADARDAGSFEFIVRTTRQDPAIRPPAVWWTVCRAIGRLVDLSKPGEDDMRACRDDVYRNPVIRGIGYSRIPAQLLGRNFMAQLPQLSKEPEYPRTDFLASVQTT